VKCKDNRKRGAPKKPNLKSQGRKVQNGADAKKALKAKQDKTSHLAEAATQTNKQTNKQNANIHPLFKLKYTTSSTAHQVSWLHPHPFAGGVTGSLGLSSTNSPSLSAAAEKSSTSSTSSSSSSSSSVMPMISPLRRPCTLWLRLAALPSLVRRQVLTGADGEFELEVLSMGPLKGERLRLAKTRPEGKPGEGGGTAPNALFPSVVTERPPVRTTRMLLGKEDEVGVAGSTLMLLCGDLVSLWPDTETAGEPMEMEDVEDALECEWWWCGIERIEETEEDVDLRPRRPPLERR